MLYGLLLKIHGTGNGSGFEAYLSNLQRERRAGIPTVREAQRDYRAVTRSRNATWMI